MTRMNARSVTSCIGARAVRGCPSAKGAGSGCGTSGQLGARPILLQAPLLKALRPVLDGVKNGARDIDRALLLQRKDDGIARAGVNLNDLRPQLVVHREEYPREEGLAIGIVRSE